MPVPIPMAALILTSIVTPIQGITRHRQHSPIFQCYFLRSIPAPVERKSDDDPVKSIPPVLHGRVFIQAELCADWAMLYVVVVFTTAVA